MARTVDTTLTMPQSASLANAEISTGLTSPDRGHGAIYLAANTLREQWRPQLICQPAHVGSPIADTVSSTVTWRVVLNPRANLGTHTIVWQVEVWRDGAGTASIDIGESGGASTNIRVEGTGPLTSIHTATHAITDAGETTDLELEIVGSSYSSIEVRAVSVYYQRQATALPAGVAADGVAAIDFAHVGDEHPVSVARVRDLLGILRAAYTMGQPALCCASETTIADGQAWIKRPTTIDGQDLELTMEIYVSVTAPATPTWTATVATPWGDLSVGGTGITSAWYSDTLEVTTRRDGYPSRDLHSAELTTSTTSGTIQIKSIALYWEAATI